MSDQLQHNSDNHAASQPLRNRKLRKCALSLLIAGPLLLCLIFVFLQSGIGKRLLTDFINSRLKPAGLQLKGIEGFLPFEIRLTELQCFDSRGIWLKAEMLAIDCTWFSGNLDLDIKRLSCSKATLLRSPESDTKQNETTQPWPLPLKDYALRAQSIQIQKLVIGQQFLSGLGIEKLASGNDGLVFSLDAKAEASRTQLSVDGTMEIDGWADALFHFRAHGSQPELIWKIEFTETGEERISKLIGRQFGKVKAQLSATRMPSSDKVNLECNLSSKEMGNLKSSFEIAIKTPRPQLTSIKILWQDSIIQADGIFDLSGGDSNGTIRGQLRDLSMLQGLIPDLGIQGSADFDARIIGPIFSPKLDAHLSIQTIATKYVGAEKVLLKFRSEPQAEHTTQFSVEGQGETITIPGIAQSFESLRFGGKVKLGDGLLTEVELSLSGSDIALTANVTKFDLSGEPINGRLQLNIDKPLPLSPGLLLPNLFDFALNVEVEAQPNKQVRATFETSARLEAINRTATERALKALFGEKINLRGVLLLDADQIHLRECILAGRDIELKANGVVSPGAKRLDIKTAVDLKNLEVIHEMLGLPLEGAIHIDADLKGEFSHPTANVTAQIKTLSIQNIHSPEAALSFTVGTEKTESGLQLIKLKGITKANRLSYSSMNLEDFNIAFELGLVPSEGSWTGAFTGHTKFSSLSSKPIIGTLAATLRGDTEGSFSLNTELGLRAGSEQKPNSSKFTLNSTGNLLRGNVDTEWQAEWPGDFLIPDQLRILTAEGIKSHGSLFIQNKSIHKLESFGSVGKIGYTATAGLDERGLHSKVHISVLDGQELRAGAVRVAQDTALSISASGNPNKPDVAIALKSSSVSLPGCVLADLEAGIKVPGLNYSAWQSGLTLNGHVRSSIAIDALRNGFPSLPTTLEFKVGLKKEELHLKALTLKSGPATLTGTATANLKDKTTDLSAKIILSNTTGLQKLYSVVPDGGFSMGVNGTANLEQELVQFRIEGDASGLRCSSALLNIALGNSPHFRTDIEMNEEQFLFKNFTMQGNQVDLAVTAGFGRALKEYSATWSGTVRDLNAFSSILGMPLAGKINLSGDVKKNAKQAKYHASLSSEMVEISGQTLNSLNFQNSFTDLPEFKGETTGSFRIGESSIKANTKIELIKNGLKISEFRIEGFDSNLDGALTFHWIGLFPVVDGTIRLKCLDLSSLASQFNATLAGSGNAVLNLQARNGTQLAHLKLVGTNLDLTLPDKSSLKMKGVHTTLRSSDLFVQDLPEINLMVSGFNFKNLTLGTASLIVKKAEDSYSIKANAVGDWNKRNVNLLLTGALSEQKVDLFKMMGMYGEVPFQLRNPASLTTDASLITLGKADFHSSELNLKVGSGNLTVQVDRKGRGINARTSATAINIRPFLPDNLSHLQGLLSGSMVLGGTAVDPQLKADITLKDLTSSEIGPEKLSITVALSGELSDQQLRGQLKVMDPSEGLSKAGRIECSFSVPVKACLEPMLLDFKTAADFSADVSANFHIARLDQILPLDEHALGGDAKLKISFEGSLNQPRWRADASITEGTYTNAITGTSLKAIQIEMDGTDSKLVISASATDSDRGRLQFKGWLVPSLQQSFVHAFDLNLERTQLARTDSLTLMADGNLSLEGDLRRHRLQGKLSVSPGEMVIPGSLSEGIAEVVITEVNGPVIEKSISPSIQSGFPSVSLNLQISVPGRVYVRGRGLTSEWKGDLSVSGTTDAPAISGTLSILRGHFLFAGKRFGIKTGNLVFSGNNPPSPVLDIETETETGGITAKLRLFGPVTTPQLELKSVPELPKDEILSRVLFGKRLASITAFQALRLGRAMKTLTGSKSAFDLAAKVRRFTGVDQFELRKGENETMGQGRVAVGKYVREGVYVEVEKGLRTNQEKVTVEVDITPNISAETELDAQGGRGVGLNWKWDY